MPRTIVFPFGSKKNSEYVVDISPAYSSQRRTTTIKGASKCCKSEVGSKRYCKDCGEETPWKAELKMFEFAGEKYVVPSEQVDSVINTMDNSDIEVKAILTNEPKEARGLYAGLRYVKPVSKLEKVYVELRNILGDNVAVVEFIDRKTQYQALMSVNDEGIIELRLLQEGEALRKPDIDVEGVAVNDEVVKLKRKILASITHDDYDLFGFRDMRNALEEEFLEGVITGKSADVIAEASVETSQQNELDELKALAGD